MHAQCPAWSYDDTAPNGPSHWGTLCPEYADCLGPQQSPIDVVQNQQIVGGTQQLAPHYDEIHNVTFGMQDYGYEILNFTGHNNITFHDHTYFLLEFHFHSPSEHFLNGVQYPLEVHFVHADAASNYAVLTFFYSESQKTINSTFLDYLVEYIPKVNDGTFAHIPSLNYQSQINTAQGFYHYEGSTTIPPCIPHVQFLISSNPIPTPPAIIQAFSKLKNVRPLQPLNNRNVTNYSPRSTPQPAQEVKWTYAAGFGGTLGIVFLGRFLYSRYRKPTSSDSSDLEMAFLLKK